MPPSSYLAFILKSASLQLPRIHLEECLLTVTIAVMPKRTLEEESARLTARAHQLEVRSKKQRLNKFVDSRPDLLDSLLSHCDKLTQKPGADGTLTSDRHVTPEKRGTGFSVRSSSSPSLGDCEAPSTATSWSTEASPEMPAACIPRCYQTFGALPAHVLTQFLTEVEPITCSPQNLRGLCGRKSRYVPKSTLQELFLMVSNVSLDDRIPKEFYAVKTFVEAGKAFNWYRYRPLKETPLPVNWSVVGNYVVLYEDEPPKVYHQILREAVDLPPSYLNAFDFHKQPQSIARNWSSATAELTVDGSVLKLPLATLFPSEMTNNMVAYWFRSSDPPKALMLKDTPANLAEDEDEPEQAPDPANVNANEDEPEHAPDPANVNANQDEPQHPEAVGEDEFQPPAPAE